ncbi:hypothetical protein Hanom_Chr03g00194771 [Helianthus anomalus]
MCNTSHTRLYLYNRYLNLRKVTYILAKVHCHEWRCFMVFITSEGDMVPTKVEMKQTK